MRSVNIHIEGSYIELNTKAEEQFTTASINNYATQTRQLPSVTLGNREFFNVYLLQVDTASIMDQRVYEAYFAIGYGLVAYRVAPDQLWVKQ
ncbi:hypothetical protein [Paracnuella aquatica]|uniref:hypothetical protein n=1 Tax=Paracnuella aquatica TaxID=2268757 RepID=UPI000F50D1B4|nr:hypothetical protein [Paracnuella aquatica]RPD48254.1 hypothetical protein DRJ53_10945 [Paracnuella aquatica]